MIKGSHLTDEHKQKIALAKTGKPSGALGKTWKIKDTSRMNKSRIGTKLSEQHKATLKENHVGFTGRKHSEESRKAFSLARKGEKSTNWKGGVTPVNELIRRSVDYKLWREAVFKRDNYTCIWCYEKGYVHADHIKPFAHYPELRFAIDNGRTLCVDCHKKTDTYGGRSRK